VLEPLLATPTSDFELLIGKGLGAFVPAMAATFASFAGLVAVVDLLTFQLFGYLLRPNLLSAVVLLVYAPLVCILSISWSQLSLSTWWASLIVRAEFVDNSEYPKKN